MKIKEYKLPIIITMLVIILGTFMYFVMGRNDSMNSDSSVYENIKIKAVYTPKEEIKLFALARNNALANYKALEGKPIPETDGIVLGYAEAEAMKKEKLFSKIDDQINLFGINAAVGGILEKTESPVDNFYFLSESQYNKLDGEENRVFVKINEEGAPKMFYFQNTGEKFISGLKLSEGSFSDYKIHNMVGKKYYPVILGSSGAEAMKKEKLFSKPGDIISEFFCNDIIIVGILSPTNTSMDIMHIAPLDANQLIDKGD